MSHKIKLFWSFTKIYEEEGYYPYLYDEKSNNNNNKNNYEYDHDYDYDQDQDLKNNQKFRGKSCSIENYSNCYF